MSQRKNPIKKRIRMAKSDVMYMTVVYIVVSLVVVIVAYPLIYVVSCSFSSPTALIAGRVVLLPVEFSLLGYQTVFKSQQVITGYINSILYTVTGTAINVVLTMAAAYPLSRKEFPARGIITLIFSFTMFFSGGMIPSYLLVKQLGLVDTIWALVLPGAVSVWLVVIARTFISTSIPEELFEAATLDGCDYVQFFFRVLVRLSAPIIAVLVLNYSTGHWNSYFNAMIYINNPDKFPLQLVLRNILVQNVVDSAAIGKMNMSVKDMMTRQYLSELLKYSLIVISCLPLLALYPFIQKYFIKGVMVGSIKG